MKRVIFTLYDDIKTTNDTWNNNLHAREQIKDYWDRLLDNKREYAEKIGADFKFYHNTMKDFDVPHDLEFTRVNLYKHHIFAELADEYDEVMYCDMDVIFNTDENIFEENDLSKGIHIKDQDEGIREKEIENISFNQIGQRDPTLKYHITKDLLGGKDCHVLNTGVMLGRSEHIKQIKYIERIKEAADKVEQIKSENLKGDNCVYLRMYYYPNNESLFSYIMEHYNVPYVLMDKEWHHIISIGLQKLDWSKIKVAHFISKKFHTYFKDKTTCFFSIYIDIPEEKLDNPRGHKDDTVGKSMRTKQRLAKYHEKLRENHREYCKSIGATYLEFGYDEQYIEFAKRFPDLSEYNIVNLYKVWLLDKVTHDYDLVGYIDLDVYFEGEHDPFDYLFCEHTLCCDIWDAYESGVNIRDKDYIKKYNKDFRNPQAKYWNAHAMLQEEDRDGDNWVFNTGIMFASRKVMEQLDYFGDIDYVIDMMKELQEFSMYPDNIQASFGYDNETIMSYKTQMNNVPVSRLDQKWHHKHDYNVPESHVRGSQPFERTKHTLRLDIKTHEVQLIHFISKNFGLVFDEDTGD